MQRTANAYTLQKVTGFDSRVLRALFPFHGEGNFMPRGWGGPEPRLVR